MNPIDAKAIEHFVRLAERGHHPAASSGEKTCAKLGKALLALEGDLAGLDGTAIRGLTDLIRCMAGPWATWEVKDAVEKTVRRAGRKRGTRNGGQGT